MADLRRDPGQPGLLWGWNTSGQVGDGSEGTIRLRPRAVVGGHLFDQVSAGGSGTCGKTPVGAAYCWGFTSGTAQIPTT
jgi:alpha-tubulin suppressor-like RCC1 family protein